MVLDGETVAGLATSRALAKEGFKIICGGSHKFSRTFYSKYCYKKFIYPSIKSGFKKMHLCILENLKKFKPDVLMPIFSETFELVLKHKEEYEKYTKLIPIVDYDLFKEVSDKQKLARLAFKLRIPTPRTYFPKNEQEVKILSKKIKYPTLIKARLSSGGRGIKLVYSPKDLCIQYRSICNLTLLTGSFDPTCPIIQEYLQGEDIDLSALFLKGKKIAYTIQKNEHFYHGSPTKSVLVNDDNAANMGLKLLKKLKWNGIAHIDMRRDTKDNTLKLIEVNPKLWSSVESSIHAGVNFPSLLCQLALNKNLNANLNYKLGSEFRWVLFGELFYLLHNRNKLQNIKELLKFRDYTCEIQTNDIKPHIAQALTFPWDRSIV